MTTPPSPIFISHSYDDAHLTVQLATRLPATAETKIFPAINVPPTETVSAQLLESIRKCRSLVWIDTEHARQSHWVTLERDYARRAGLEVFRFDAESKRLHTDSAPLLQLPVFSSYARDDRQIVGTIVGLMKDRYLDTFYDIQDLKSGEVWSEQIERGLTARLDAGGYCVAFWSKNTERSRYVTDQLRRAARSYPDQILPVRLDNTRLPEPLNSRQAFGILTPDGSVDLRLVDNLILWIYWTVQSNREAQA
jgi:TIR domain